MKRIDNLQRFYNGGHVQWMEKSIIGNTIECLILLAMWKLTCEWTRKIKGKPGVNVLIKHSPNSFCKEKYITSVLYINANVLLNCSLFNKWSFLQTISFKEIGSSSILHYLCTKKSPYPSNDDSPPFLKLHIDFQLLHASLNGNTSLGESELLE